MTAVCVNKSSQETHSIKQIYAWISKSFVWKINPPFTSYFSINAVKFSYSLFLQANLWAVCVQNVWDTAGSSSLGYINNFFSSFLVYVWRRLILPKGQKRKKLPAFSNHIEQSQGTPGTPSLANINEWRKLWHQQSSDYCSETGSFHSLKAAKATEGCGGRPTWEPGGFISFFSN